MAAAPSSLGEQIHEELTCSICLALFTRPKPAYTLAVVTAAGVLLLAVFLYNPLHGLHDNNASKKSPETIATAALEPESEDFMVQPLPQTVTFGGRGSGTGQFNHPSGVAMSDEGEIIVADWGNSRVEMFDKTGRFIKHIATDSELTTRPCGVAIGPQGQLVVTDLWENVIHTLDSY
uniref:SMP-30/Gluconolactonase/LRE-like region domain-containing protein n=1 Tax=Branchiostoma floridae TaxID=7739 RepID=C3ZJ69_BRAFL|eukprot:XP_002591389.1 hypothetical protein BRAFLDRAFT_86896 [Branchiostoma floridae]